MKPIRRRAGHFAATGPIVTVLTNRPRREPTNSLLLDCGVYKLEAMAGRSLAVVSASGPGTRLVSLAPLREIASRIRKTRMRPRSIHGGLQMAVVLCAFALAASTGARSASAEEPFDKFLEALKEDGLYDIALDYVRSMKDSPLLSNEQRIEMPLTEGQLLVESAQAERDTATKFKQLDQAREHFENFIKANASHPVSAHKI